MGVYQRHGDQTPGRESQASKGVEEELWWGGEGGSPGSSDWGTQVVGGGWCLDTRGFWRRGFRLGVREALDLAAVARLSQREESEG